MGTSSGERFGTLSASLVNTTLIAVVFVVVTISITSLVGTYDLAHDQALERQRTYVEVIASDLELRLTGAAGVVQRASASVQETGPVGVDRIGFEAAFNAGIRRVDALVVLRDAHPVVALIATGLPDIASDSEFLERVAADDSPYYRTVRDGGEVEIWVAQSVAPGTFVLGRVRHDLLEETLSRVAAVQEGRVAVVLDDTGTVLMGADTGMALESSAVRVSATTPPEGDTEFETDAGIPTSAHYRRITVERGIDWMVLVGEPTATVFDAALGALVPTALALVLSGVVSLFVAYLVGIRLARPLIDIETRANDGATGAFVQPIETDRQDEIGRLVDAFNVIALRLNALHDLSKLLASSSRSDQVLDGILAAISHMVGSEHTAVYLWDAGHETLAPVRARGLLERAAVPLVGSDDDWLVQVAHGTGCGVLRGPVSAVSESLDIGGGETAASLAAPLVLADRTLGVILVVRPGSIEYSQAEVEMVRTFSAQAAVAVRNARLFAEESRSRREAELMREVVERLARPGDLRMALDSVGLIACELLDISACIVTLFEPGRFSLPEVERPQEQALAEIWAERENAEGTLSFALYENRHVDELLEWSGTRHVDILPIVCSGEYVGVMAFFTDDEAQSLVTRVRRLAEAVVTQVSLAVQNVYYFEQARMRATDLETVFRISQAVGSSLQIRVVLNRVLDVVQKIFSAEAVALMTYDESRKTLSTAMARGSVSSNLLHYHSGDADDIIAMVFHSREPARIDELSKVVDAVTVDAAYHGLESVLLVPLMARGRSIGVLSVFSSRAGAFSDQDMDLLRTFAAQAALAIDTARVYGREHKVASVLKSSILPEELPEFTEVDTSTMYRPSGGDADIGGDYYDVFYAPDGRIVAAVADVCGKGVLAATKTSMVKYTLRALVAAGFGPARCLAEVNRVLATEGDAMDIVTAWIGFLDVRAGILEYADAGHPPGLLLRTDGHEVVRLEVTGALLGASTAARYEECSVRVGPGDVLVLYTDGVTEAREGNKFFGEGRVRRALRYGGSAVDVSQRLQAALDRFVHGDLRDDAAVLVLKIRDVHDDRFE